MQLGKLPDSVLYSIIRYSLSLNTRTPERFKENSVLLAICHKLRILGLPLVYDAIFIYPAMFGAYTSYSDQIKNAQSLMGPGIDTNLDLIHEGGLSSIVTTFMVELHFDTQPFSKLRHILGILARVNKIWSSIEKLHIVFRPDLFALGGQNINLAQYEGNIITTCSMLVKTMPRVTMLEFREVTHSTLVRELCGRITTVYASKLVRLTSRAQLYMHKSCELVGLKQLSLDWNNDVNGQCPRISPDSLVSLRLTTGAGKQIWQPFVAASSSKIVFPCLQFLQVVYSSWQESGLEYDYLLPNKRGQQYMLHFPKLKTLYVNDKHCTKRFLSSIVLPAYMESITIHASATGIRNIGQCVLPKSRNVTLVLDSYASNTQTLELANNVLSMAKESKQLQLRIFNSELLLSAKTISCTNLTHLYVAAPICVNTTIELVLKLRSLCELGIQSLKLGDFNCDNIPKPNSHTQVAPFNTRLKFLDLHFEHEFSAYTMVKVVKFLLLKIPTLERVISPKVPKKPVLDFIEEHKDKYPHLKYLGFMRHTLPETEGY